MEVDAATTATTEIDELPFLDTVQFEERYHTTDLELGRGSQGSVRKAYINFDGIATKTSDQHGVAFKIIRIVDNHPARASATSELYALQQLKNKDCIIKMIEAFRIPNCVCFVLEFAATSLSNRLKIGSLHRDVVSAYTHDLFEGLAAGARSSRTPAMTARSRASRD